MATERYTITLEEWELAVLADDLDYVVRHVLTGDDHAWNREVLTSIYERLLWAYGLERAEDGRWRYRSPMAPTAHGRRQRPDASP